jgi:hypothetical protein
MTPAIGTIIGLAGRYNGVSRGHSGLFVCICPDDERAGANGE